MQYGFGEPLDAKFVVCSLISVFTDAVNTLNNYNAFISMLKMKELSVMLNHFLN